MLLGLLYRIIGDFFSYIGDIGDIGGTTMAGIDQGVWYLLYFLYRGKKFLYSYIGSPKGPKPPIFGHLWPNFFKKVYKGWCKKMSPPKI